METIGRQDFQLIAPPHTPFSDNGQVDLSKVPRQAEWLARTGVDGVFVAGSTGESLSLTVPERMELAEAWVEATVGQELTVIAHVGHNCQAEAIRLAAHAEQIGADAVACMAPSFFRPTDVATLVTFLEPIAAAAFDLPIYFYDIPQMTGVHFPVVDFLREASVRLPNLAGVKFTCRDLVELQQGINLDGGKYQLFFGVDEMLLGAYALGACGAIGSSYNFMAPLYRDMIGDAHRGDWTSARAKQLQALEICGLLHRYGYLAASKCVMKMLGIDCGTVRPPLSPLSRDRQQQLLAELAGYDVFPEVLEESRLFA